MVEKKKQCKEEQKTILIFVSVTDMGSVHRMVTQVEREAETMGNERDDWSKGLHSEQAEELMKNKAALQDLLKAPETVKLMQLLEQKSGGNLKSAAQAATKGDTAMLLAIMNEVMSAQDGAKAVEQLKKKLPGQ